MNIPEKKIYNDENMTSCPNCTVGEIVQTTAKIIRAYKKHKIVFDGSIQSCNHCGRVFANQKIEDYNTKRMEEIYKSQLEPLDLLNEMIDQYGVNRVAVFIFCSPEDLINMYTKKKTILPETYKRLQKAKKVLERKLGNGE